MWAEGSVTLRSPRNGSFAEPLRLAEFARIDADKGKEIADSNLRLTSELKTLTPSLTFGFGRNVRVLDSLRPATPIAAGRRLADAGQHLFQGNDPEFDTAVVLLRGG